MLPYGDVPLHYFEKKKKQQAQSAVYSHVVVCSSCCRYDVHLDCPVYSMMCILQKLYMNLRAILVQKEMYQKWNIAHLSHIPIQVCDHILLE